MKCYNTNCKERNKYMETKIVKFDDKEVIKSIQNGEVVAFPTETVYGLGVRYDNYEAFKKLVEVKRRPPEKPFTLMGGNSFKFEDFAELDDKALELIKKYVPGPITLLCKPKKGLYKHVTLNSPAIGIRVSGDEKLRSFIDSVGVPLLVPSANKSGEPPLINSKDVYEVFNGEIPFVIDDVCNGGLPSTIVDISTPNTIKLIRQGDIPFDEIKNFYEKA